MKLGSRKLWVAIASIASVVIGAWSGGVAWTEAVPSIAAIAVGYCVAQGWVDAKTAESVSMGIAQSLKQKDGEEDDS